MNKLIPYISYVIIEHNKAAHIIPDNKIHGANMGPTWVLLAPGGPHCGHMTLAFRDLCISYMAEP